LDPTSLPVPEPAPRSRHAVALALVGAVVCISFAAIFFRKALPTNPVVAAGLRLVIAAALLAPAGIRSIRAGRADRRVITAGALGGLAYGVHFGAWVSSLALTSIAASVTIVTSTPLLLAVAALVTGRDRPEPRLWAAIALGATGLLVISGNDLGLSSDALLGDALAFVGAAAMAAYLLVARRLGSALDIWAFSFMATLVGGVALLLGALLAGIPIEASSRAALGWIVLSALVPQLIGHNLLTWALRHAKPTLVGMATVGEPVGSTILGWWLLSEAVSPQVALGCAITLTGVLLAMRPASRPPPD